MPNSKSKTKKVIFLILAVIIFGLLIFGGVKLYQKYKSSPAATVVGALTTGPPTSTVTSGTLGTTSTPPRSGGILSGGPAPGGILNPINHLPMLVSGFSGGGGIRNLFGR